MLIGVIPTSPFFLSINSLYFVVFIVAMAITHTFIDFIPSIFLGCPDTDTELSILPGHKLLKEGKGYEAVMLTAYGGLGAIFLFLIMFFPLIIIVERIYDFLRIIIPYLLIIVLILLIFSEKNKFTAFSVFVLTGLLGTIIFELDLKEPLLPLLTGLFGSSMLILSIKNKIQITTVSLGVSMGLAETAWAISFLPFGYFILGALFTVVFGAVLNIISSYYKVSSTDPETFKKIVTRSVILAFVFIIIFVTISPWLPQK